MSAQAPGYGSLLKSSAFVALLVSQVGVVLPSTIAGLTLSLLVLRESGSVALAGAAMFAPSAAQVVAAAWLMGVADGPRPRLVLTLCHGIVGAACAAQVLDLALPARFLLLLLSGVAAAVSTGVRLGALTRVVTGSEYMAGRSLLNLASGVIQLVGFSAGAALLVVTGTAGSFATAATIALLGLLGLRAIPRDQPTERNHGLRSTTSTNRLVLRDRGLRQLLLASWLPAGLVVGGQSLFVPYAGERAGFLFTCSAVGMIIGDVLFGRAFAQSAALVRLAQTTRTLAPLALCGLALSPPAPLAAVLAAVAALGFGPLLVLQATLTRSAPAGTVGQLQGVESAGRLAAQAVGAVLAGLVADATSLGIAFIVIAMAAAASALATASALRPAAHTR